MYLQPRREMQQVRKPQSDVTALYEDAGLFKTALCQLMVELIPLMRVNDRQDTVVRGFVDRKTEIDVYFAGRRAAEIGPLNAQLRHLMATARKSAAASGARPPQIEHIRLPVRIEGAWRRSPKRDEFGWETGSYHLVAARWSLLDQDGKTVSYGEPPVV